MKGSAYYDANAVRQVIGDIFKDPSLLAQDGQYFLTEEDFTNDVHRIIYGVASNIYNTRGGKELSIVDIVNYLDDGRTEAKQRFEAANGAKYITECIEFCSRENFKMYYDRIKKMTLLRNYARQGVDVSWLYDPSNLIDKEQTQHQSDEIDKMSLSEIADKIESRVNLVRVETINRGEEDAVKIGDGIFDFLGQLAETPEMGMPFSFDEFSNDGYSHILNRVTMGARKGKFYLRSAASGVGKALVDSAIIPTPSGNKKVSDIKVGDYLFDRQGYPTKVIGVFPQGEREVYRVFFKDGRYVDCSKDHLWSYYYDSHRGKRLRTETTEEILNRCDGCFVANDQSFKFRVPLNGPVQYPEKDYLVPPYTFGALLGDGSFRMGNSNKILDFSSGDEEIVEHIALELNATYVKNKGNNYTWHFKRKEVKKGSRLNFWVEDVLAECPELINAYSEDKYIPEKYLCGSVEQRQELLRGLMDTDGSIDDKGRLSYYTISSSLRDDIITLVRSLGYTASYGVDRREDKYLKTNGCGYYIRIQAPTEKKQDFFCLARKKQKAVRLCSEKKRREKNTTMPIVDIQKINRTESMTCFLVDNPEHLFLANDFIVTHNTRYMIADACMLGCSSIWVNNSWVSLTSKEGMREGVLFISTELDENELRSLMLAFVSGVNEEKIITRSYTPEEQKRIIAAANILKQAPIYVKVLPNFTVADVENTIKRAHIKDGCNYIFYDYLGTSLGILEEMGKRTHGVSMREDSILFLLSTRLKELAVQYNIFIESSTQLNASYQDSKTPDQNLLRGSKSIADRLDIGSILLNPTQEDKENLVDAGYIQLWGREPNAKLSIYKNRRGKYVNCYIWLFADKGTCRFSPIGATTWNYEPYEIPEMILSAGVKEVSNE